MRLTTSSVAAIENMLKQRRVTGEVSTTSNVSVREALRSRGDDAKKVIIKELRQMIDKKVWVPTMMSTLDSSQVKSIIRSSMFVKRKNYPDGTFEKYKVRLVAGGDQQDKELYDDLSSPTVATSSVFTMLSVSAYERRHSAVVGGVHAIRQYDV